MPFKNSTLHQLLDFRPDFASILHDYGIRFYNFDQSTTLKQACQQTGLSVDKVIRELEANSGLNRMHTLASIMDQYPIRVVVGYLKHMHKLFLYRRIPYFLDLLENMDAGAEGMPSYAADLQAIFPVFAEDFVDHIYEEEDSLFARINELRNFLRLGKAVSQETNLSRPLVQDMAEEHKHDDDEMEGIRELTNFYAIYPTMPLHLKVVLAHLSTFDHELQVHAKVENKVLFPKAIALENEALHRHQFLMAFN